MKMYKLSLKSMMVRLKRKLLNLKNTCRLMLVRINICYQDYMARSITKIKKCLKLQENDKRTIRRYGARMKIQIMKLNDLIEYENNPRNNDDAVDAVANSINEFGFKVPIIITKDNIIVAGHTRLKAALKLGLTEVPCLIADDLNEDQIKSFRLADNKTAELATWDLKK